jgi:hypothetical protein
MDLERTYVHPLFYGLALEIAQVCTSKTKKKGAAAIESFRRLKNPPVLSQQELKTIFETNTSSTLVQVALDFFLPSRIFSCHNLCRNFNL